MYISLVLVLSCLLLFIVYVQQLGYRIALSLPFRESESVPFLTLPQIFLQPYGGPYGGIRTPEQFGRKT